MTREQFEALLNQGSVVTIVDLEEAGQFLRELWGPTLESSAHRKALVQGLFGPRAHVRVPKPPRRFQVGVVSSQELEAAPGRRLDAGYHLGGEARRR